MKVKEEIEKVGFKLNIQKTKIMASGPITSWQIKGGKSRGSDRFLFLGSKITADGDCSHEIRRCLLLGRKVMSNLESILKSRDITLPTKVCLVKASLVAQRVKHLPAMWETWVQSLHWEDPPEKEMAIHSSILAGEIPWISHGLP